MTTITPIYARTMTEDEQDHWFEARMEEMGSQPMCGDCGSRLNGCPYCHAGPWEKCYHRPAPAPDDCPVCGGAWTSPAEEAGLQLPQWVAKQGGAVGYGRTEAEAIADLAGWSEPGQA